MAEARYSRSAESDLLEAWLHFAEENPVAADGLLDAIDREAARLARQPLLGRQRSEIAGGLRSWASPHPFVIFYLVEGVDVRIIRILHHARDVQREHFQASERAPDYRVAPASRRDQLSPLFPALWLVAALGQTRSVG